MYSMNFVTTLPCVLITDYYRTIHKHLTKDKHFDEAIHHTYVDHFICMWEVKTWICWISYISQNVRLHFILICIFMLIHGTFPYIVVVKPQIVKFWHILVQIILIWVFYNHLPHYINMTSYLFQKFIGLKYSIYIIHIIIYYYLMELTY